MSIEISEIDYAFMEIGNPSFSDISYLGPLGLFGKEIENPVSVRYGRADNPKSINLFTVDRLPASPFEIKRKLP